MTRETGAAYATRAEFFRFGMSAAALRPVPRTVRSVSVVDSRLSIPLHGAAEGDAVVLTSSTSYLPAPLSVSTVYYVKLVSDSDDLIQLSATSGGSAITLTDAGSGTIAMELQIGALIDSALEAWSRVVDDSLVAYNTPLAAWPGIVTLVVCKLAAFDLVCSRGLANPQFADAASEYFAKQNDWANAQLQKWRDGQPLRVVTTAQTESQEGTGAIGWTDTTDTEDREI